jgi:hypothetical protein
VEEHLASSEEQLVEEPHRHDNCHQGNHHQSHLLHRTDSIYINQLLLTHL